MQGRPGTRTPAPLEQEHLVHPTGAPVPSFLRCVLCTLGHRSVCRNPCLVWDCAWQLRRMHSLSWLCQRATTDAAARTVLEPCQLNVCMHCADQLNTHHLLCVCSFALHVHSFEMHALCQVGSKSCVRRPANRHYGPFMYQKKRVREPELFVVRYDSISGEPCACHIIRRSTRGVPQAS